MKVLQLGKFFPPDIGGIETAMYEITEGLNKRGIRCDVLCSNSGREYREDTINCYRVYRTKSYGKIASTSVSPQMICKFKEIVDSYDIIHLHSPDPMANMALFLINPKRQKVIIHWHSDIVKQKFLLQFYRPLLFWMLRRADVILGTSSLYVEGSTFLKDFQDKISILPFGIKKLDYQEEKVNKIKSKFPGKKIVFSLGRFVYYKGFEYLIRSSEYLDDSYVILLGGTGKEEQKLRILAKPYQNKVFFLGNIPGEELGNYYKACDIFCLPSIERSEAFGLVIVEAMSFGKPVVTTKIPYSGVSWLNQDGITGINVEPKNSEALAYTIMKICKNEALYKTMSENALMRYREHFTNDKYVDSLIQLYEKILIH